jgi:AcrR family transcriptional regulator
MARTAGSSGTRSAAAIREAGLRLIYRNGYAAMSLRDLAREVGLTPGSLYNYFESKQSLLFGLLESHLTELLAKLDEALAGVEGAEARLAAFATFHVRYHMARRQETFVVNSELRSLDPEHYAVIVGLRRRYEATLQAILEQGVEGGVFAAQDIRVSSFAILALLTGVCGWYTPGGRLPESEIVALHVSFALSAARNGPSASSSPAPRS